jgi:hypothetical protein
MIGARCIVIQPDRDVEIGVLAADEMIQLQSKMTPTGAVIDVHKVKRSTPADGRSIF